MAWTYLLRCSDGSYYVGSTTNLELRLGEHQEGIGSAYTAARLPATLVFAGEFPSIEAAYQFENQVKKWRRAKKEALIRGDYSALPQLAKGHKGK